MARKLEVFHDNKWPGNWLLYDNKWPGNWQCSTTINGQETVLCNKKWPWNRQHSLTRDGQKVGNFVSGDDKQARSRQQLMIFTCYRVTLIHLFLVHDLLEKCHLKAVSLLVFPLTCMHPVLPINLYAPSSWTSSHSSPMLTAKQH